MKNEVLFMVIFIIAAIVNIKCDIQYQQSWFWVCNIANEKCLRKHQGDIKSDTVRYKSLPVCRLTCGKYGALWPQPTVSTNLGPNVTQFHPDNVGFQVLNAENGAKMFLLKIANIFKDNLFLNSNDNIPIKSKNKMNVVFKISSSNTGLNWNTDESYSLKVTTNDGIIQVNITATNVYGIRHGLETLSQLAATQPTIQGDNYEFLVVSEAKIEDKPIYRHRGLLLDTSRNYIPEETIKRQIDGMAASKLNVFHWHATDSQSFPVDVPRVPQLARYGAYSIDKTYGPATITSILNYAKLRGVRVIMEIDAPSHSGNGWQWGNSSNLGDLAVCVNKNPWRWYCIQPPCGQLNPVNPNVYRVMADLYSDLIDIFPKNETFHMGGDEVFIPCWNSTPEIVDYLKQHNKGQNIKDFLDLWGNYQAQVLKAFDSKVGNELTPIILWSSILTEPDVITNYLPNNRYIIQTWVPLSSNLPTELLELGYELIISTKDAWYLDHGFWGNTVYYDWRTVYNNKIFRHHKVLGGEVCMWGELVDENNIDSRIWPRAAAAAERLWSDPDSNTASPESRMYTHRERLVQRKIKASALVPLWCYQNEGECN